MFWSNILHPSSGLMNVLSKKPSLLYCMLHGGFLLGLLFSAQDGGNMFFQDIIWLSADYTALYPRD
jgi:hypothetical protein